MEPNFQIKTCPTCGSDQIRRVKRDLSRDVKGQTYTVPEVEVHECPICGERVYDRKAMQKIRENSPLYRN